MTNKYSFKADKRKSLKKQSAELISVLFENYKLKNSSDFQTAYLALSDLLIANEIMTEEEIDNVKHFKYK